jgi:hypothetical protein
VEKEHQAVESPCLQVEKRRKKGIYRKAKFKGNGDIKDGRKEGRKGGYNGRVQQKDITEGG